MERSVISRGKTVEQAIDRALTLLEASKQQVSIEVIDEENKGLLGFNVRPAVVKVTLMPEQQQFLPGHQASDQLQQVAQRSSTAQGIAEREVVTDNQSYRQPLSVLETEQTAVSITDDVRSYADIPSAEAVRNGQIWIEGGEVRVRTFPGGALPKLDAFKSGDVLINGEPLMAGLTAEINEQDRIEIMLTEELREPIWQVQIDAKAMTVSLHVEPGSHIQRYLLDTEPEARLMLRVGQRREIVPIESARVLEQLQTLGVVHGIDRQALEQTCRVCEAGEYTIAKGTEPIPGADAMFELHADTEAKKVQPKLRHDGTIDYRETREFPSVGEGELIGVIRPAKPGQAGIDVYGRQIAAPAVRQMQILAGKDVKLSEDGLQAIAGRAGMPTQVKQGYNIKLSIVPKLMQSGDINLSTGNIHFLGDVEISGAVQDTMKVEAEGNIHIRGNINMANIVAGQSLIVNANVISSHVIVGQIYLFYGQIAPLLQTVAEQSELLKAAIRQVSSASAFKHDDMNEYGLAPLFKVLFQGRFRGMYDMLQYIIKLREQYGVLPGDDWKRYYEQLQRGFLTDDSSHFRTADDLEGFIRRTRYLYSVVVVPAMEQIFARLHHVQNSHIRCGGNLIIEKGCYNAHLYCEGHLQADGNLRGGTYYAVSGMTVQEAGSPGTGSTSLRVGEKAVIRAKKILAGTTIQVGERIHQFTKDMEHVEVSINSNNEFVWHGE
ncbi:FapA family protein [Paenibacillus campi]|uniref:FapA family protein n=1 Tax=Paenibacillus campi TaxID=3106031 RepID=UPI002AFFB9EA|nr:FapA family protein [Paenibacillus sp. SGZ-1009]